jgi:hypothetical protein
MGCNCINEKKADFGYIRKLANAYSLTEKVDVKIYKYYQHGVGDVYDFEENWIKSNREVIEVIRFQQLESAPVLSDVGNIEPTIVDEGQTGTAVEPEPVVKKVSKSGRRNNKPVD